MILIISENNERTTNEIIRWLISLKKDFIRVHENEVFEIKSEDNRIYIKSKRNCFFIDEITTVWYRRGGIWFLRKKYENQAINMHMNEHQHWLEDYVKNYLEKKNHINKESNYHVNKLIVLDTAQEIGFDVPKYFLTNNTDRLEINKTITKPPCWKWNSKVPRESWLNVHFNC
ncbi:hypothetical protein [Chryseobacterium sp. Leaf405]|uniref:hypothetical protein n=1 Tax=Chryseobacterium sp. Leaf405 TaxID=1736367 RepID=UPI000A91E693|nr:hypothetical protein [Chryseobacterium sp. Leaf405]